MKKLLILFLVLFNISIYSLNIAVIDKDGNPLKETIININNSVKITNSQGVSSFDINDSSLDITLSKEGYQGKTLSMKNHTSSSDITFIMTPLKYSNVTFEFSLPNGIIKYREVGAKSYKKVPFFKTLKSIKLPVGTYEFIFSSQESTDYYKILTFSEQSEYFFVNFDIKKEQFFFISNYGEKQGIHFYKNNIGKITPTKGIELIISKEGKVLSKLKLYDTFTPFELEYGRYDFALLGKNGESIFYNGVKLDSSTYKNIVFTVNPIQTNVSGTIKNKGQFIGGATLTFTDVNNNAYKTISNFVGEFNISLPPQKYKITLDKPGFNLSKNQNLIYDFLTPHEKYSLELNTEELFSNVDGTIVDTKGNPIVGAKIFIKNNGEIITLESDNFGNFSTSTLPGLLFITAQKEGYKSFGIVSKLERFSSLSGLKIPLTPFLSNISGIISNSFFPLKNMILTLRDKEGNIVANTISNQNGFYEFADININGEYFISVGDPAYKHYYSDFFVLGKKDIINKNIILESKNSRIYIKFLNANNLPLSNIKVNVQDKIYTTDTNGFLLLELPEKTKSINVKVNSYNYNKKINIENLNDNPNKLTLIIK